MLRVAQISSEAIVNMMIMTNRQMTSRFLYAEKKSQRNPDKPCSAFKTKNITAVHINPAESLKPNRQARARVASDEYQASTNVFSNLGLLRLAFFEKAFQFH
jgi:hypothetical protein